MAMSGVITVAALVDLVVGEPRESLHPTVWMGRAIASAQEVVGNLRPVGALAAGLAIVCGGVVGVALLAGAAGAFMASVAQPAALCVAGLMLKPAFSIRELLVSAQRVEVALLEGNLDLSRQLLARIVSRPTAELEAHEVAGATISSLAENLSDAVVAPLMAYAALGLAGAFAYRFINTADAMLGYRTRELEWLGKPAARLDDVVNLVPARVTAVLVTAAATFMSMSGLHAARTASQDHVRTPSPNGGWPMAAMAGGLGVRLDKRDVYVINAGARDAAVGDIARARRLVIVVTVVTVLLTEAATWLWA